MSAKKLSAACALALGLFSTTPYAAATAPTVEGTSWDLTGKISGTIKAGCKVGGFGVRNIPFKGQKDLNAAISFEAGDTAGDNEGTFTWSNDDLHPGTATGTWTQDGSNIDLAFDSWQDSPFGAIAFALLQAQAFIIGGPGYSASLDDLRVTKLDFTAKINSKGTLLKTSETMGFSFNASASAYGQSNSCQFEIKKLGRTYTGKPAQ